MAGSSPAEQDQRQQMLIAIGEASEKAFKEGYEMFKQPMALAENTLTCAGKVKSVEDLVKQFGKPKRKG